MKNKCAQNRMFMPTHALGAMSGRDCVKIRDDWIYLDILHLSVLLCLYSS